MQPMNRKSSTLLDWDIFGPVMLYVVKNKEYFRFNLVNSCRVGCRTDFGTPIITKQISSKKFS